MDSQRLTGQTRDFLYVEISRNSSINVHALGWGILKNINIEWEPSIFLTSLFRITSCLDMFVQRSGEFKQKHKTQRKHIYPSLFWINFHCFDFSSISPLLRTVLLRGI